MTTCGLQLLLVLVIASSHGQTTTDDDVCEKVAKHNSVQDLQTMLEYQQHVLINQQRLLDDQQQLLQTITSRLGKKQRRPLFCKQYCKTVPEKKK